MHENLVDEAEAIVTRLSESNSKHSKNTLAIFNLDYTVLEIDVDRCWGYFLTEQNHINLKGCRDRNDYFCELKSCGELDTAEYAKFVADTYNHLGDKKEHLIKDFVQKIVMPNIRPKALATLRAHKTLEHTLIFTSDSEDSIAQECCFSIWDAIYPVNGPGGLLLYFSTELQKDQNGYNGDIDGLANYLEGKVEGLKEGYVELGYCGIEPEFVYVYSNSFNDLTLLEFADTAYAVTPDARLRAEAESRGWAILEWGMST